MVAKDGLLYLYALTPKQTCFEWAALRGFWKGERFENLNFKTAVNSQLSLPYSFVVFVFFSVPFVCHCGLQLDRLNIWSRVWCLLDLLSKDIIRGDATLCKAQAAALGFEVYT